MMIAPTLAGLWILKFWGQVGTVAMEPGTLGYGLSQVEETFFTPSTACANGMLIHSTPEVAGNGLFRLDGQGRITTKLQKGVIGGVQNGAGLDEQGTRKAFKTLFPTVQVPLQPRVFQAGGLACGWSVAETSPSNFYLKSNRLKQMTLLHSPVSVQISANWICVVPGREQTVIVNRKDGSITKIPNVNWVGLGAHGEPIFCRFKGRGYRDKRGGTLVMDLGQHELARIPGWVCVAEYQSPDHWSGLRYERSHLGQPFAFSEGMQRGTIERNAERISSRGWLLDWGQTRRVSW